MDEYVSTGGIDQNIRLTWDVRIAFERIGGHGTIVCLLFARNLRQQSLNHSFTSHSKASKRVLKAGKFLREKLVSWS
jgi:hypothetical protein